jgi:tetratricopeptide (TPR) repeat protein
VIVVLCTVVAVGAIVGGTVLMSRNERTSFATQPGYPKLELSFGLRTSAEARALDRAEQLYDLGNVAAAAPVFARYHSLEAQIGSAFATWKSGGFATMQQLGSAYPDSPLVLLHLGLADFWAGRNVEAVAAWEMTAKLGSDSPYGVAAEDLLHPADPVPGLPVILLPGAPQRAPTAAQLGVIRRAAAKPNVRAKLLYGYELWAVLEKPISAEREFAAAAALAPHDPLARTLAAVGLFTKANPVRAFGTLGPLTAVFPHSPVVEFHLGVLLLYIGKYGKAAAQLHAALADGPHSPFAASARTLLASLARARSK